MTNYDNTTKIPLQPRNGLKIPLQLDAQQIGVLLGCTESIVKMGYGGKHQMLMLDTIAVVEAQIRFLTR